MANVRTNIGGLGMAIEGFKSAHANRSIGPIPDSYSDFNVDYDSNTDIEFNFSYDNDLYIWGIHKWGDTTNKVGD